MVMTTLAPALACGSGSEEQARETTASGSEPPTLPQGREPVNLDPADFTSEIDNPYWPMRPGAKWVYRETDARGQ